jgi:hypothetical protein
MQAKVGEHPTAAQQRQLEALHRAARRMKAEAEAEAKALAKDGAAMLTDLLSATARKGDAKGVWDVIKATGGAGAGKKPNRMTAMVQELVDGTSAKPEHSAIDVLGPRSTWEGRMSVEEAARYAAGIHANYIAGVVREQGEQDPDFDGAEYSRVVREVHKLEVEAEKQVGEDLARQQAVGRTRDSKEGEEAAEDPSTRLNDLFTVDEILGVVQTIKGTSATLGTAAHSMKVGMVTLRAPGEHGKADQSADDGSAAGTRRRAGEAVAGDGDGGKDTGTHVDPETVKNVEALVEHLNASWATATPTRHSSGVNVTPIFKGGNPRLPSNYRTVGVGDYMTKVLLTALERRLTRYLVDTGAIHPLQSGFQAGRDTTEQILLSQLLMASEQRAGRPPPQCVYMDLSRAYGNVSHAILVKKLAEAGVHGRLLLYLKRWLGQQTMCVVVDGQYSQPFAATKGVVEGAPISPILFLLYFNSVLVAAENTGHPEAGVPLSVIEEGEAREILVCLLGYADDVKSFARGPGGTQAILEAVGRELFKLRFKFNLGVTKTTVLGRELEGNGDTEEGPRPKGGQEAGQIFVPASAVAGASPMVEGELMVLPVAYKYRYLGVIEAIGVDGRVTYALQVDKVVTTARDMKRSFAAGRLAQLPIVAGASALVGLLMPRVTYGAGVWSGGVVPKEAQKALDGTMHMMLHTSYLPKEAAHALTGVPSLQHTYDTQVLQRIVAVCCSPRHSALRSAVAAEVRLWKRWTEGAADSKRACQQGLQGLWVTQVFALLHQLSAAIQWNSVSVDAPPHGVEPPFRPTECRARPYSEEGPVDWVDSVLRVILFDDRDTDEEEEAELSQAMDKYRYDAMQVLRFRRRVCTLWVLSSMNGLASFHAERRPPPFIHQEWGDGVRLRVMAHGGVHCLVGVEVYKALKARGRWAWSPLPAGQDEGKRCNAPPLCPLCDGPLTIPHLARDCPHPIVSATRTLVLEECRDWLLECGSTGEATRFRVTDARVANRWLRVCLGREVHRDFLMGDAEEGVGVVDQTRVLLGLVGEEEEEQWWDDVYDSLEPEGRDTSETKRMEGGRDTRGSKLRVWPRLMAVTTKLWKVIVREVRMKVDPDGNIRKKVKAAAVGRRAKRVTAALARGRGTVAVGSVAQDQGRRTKGGSASRPKPGSRGRQRQRPGGPTAPSPVTVGGGGHGRRTQTPGRSPLGGRRQPGRQTPSGSAASRRARSATPASGGQRRGGPVTRSQARGQGGLT